MSHVDERVAPKREDRLGACITYGGGACGLKKKFGGCCLKNSQRGFGQGSICQLLPGTAILNTIPDSLLIVHGALGCGGASHGQNATIRWRQALAGDKNPPGTRWLTTALNERDVVTGGEEKLEKAIIEADKRYRPSAIIVLSSCVPGIIGDDIDGVAIKLQPRVNAKILPVHCEGFKTQIMATAYDAIYHSISRNLLTPLDEREKIIVDDLEIASEKIRRSKLVNLLNVSSMGLSDENELIRLINTLGLEAQTFPCYQHPEKMRLATEAALSVSTCPTHDDYFIKFLEERYGVPYLLKHMPIGIEATGNWLRDIGKFFGLEEAAEKIVEQEEAEILRALAPFKERLKGKKAMLSAGEVRTLGTALFLKELGMEIVAVRPYHYDEFGETTLDKLIEVQEDVVVNVATVHPFESVNIIEKTQPDIYLGHCSDNVWAAKSGIAVLPIYNSSYSYIGYNGAYDLARRVDRILRNPSFNRNLSKNVRQPYNVEWFKQDSFAFISEGSEYGE